VTAFVLNGRNSISGRNNNFWFVLAPSDFHLFTYLKQFLGGMRMGSNEEVKKTVKDWFNGLAVDFYYVGIQKLITR
jgi:hypothetical protein